MTQVVIPLEERWREKVIGPWADPLIGPDDCWLWRAGGWMSLHGYGRIFVDGDHRSRQAHVVAFELFKGPVPKGKVVMHTECDEPACCNPAHLELGTYQENTWDMIGKGRWSGVVAARALMDYEERVAVDAELDVVIAASAPGWSVV
jgi:hypothetical protein